MAVLLLILGFLWRRGQRLSAGDAFIQFVAVYAGLRLFLEAFRADAPLMNNGVRATQVIALGVMLGGLGYLYRRRLPPEASTGDVSTVETR
jgi:prolipoprotein diacylglyceryltransferase